MRIKRKMEGEEGWEKKKLGREKKGKRNKKQ